MENAESAALLLHVPLATKVRAAELQALLDGLTELYRVVQTLQQAEEGRLLGAASLTSSEQQDLWIEELVIGTPNSLKLRGKGKAILGALTVAAAILAVPKLVAEIEKTQAEAEKIRIETTSAELDLLERANRLLSEGKISRDQHLRIIQSLKIASDSLRRASGVVREDVSATTVHEFREQKYMLLLLQRARALGVDEPAVSLWIGTLTNDIPVLDSALHAGADPNAAFGHVLQSLTERVGQDAFFREYLLKYLDARSTGQRAGDAEA